MPSGDCHDTKKHGAVSTKRGQTWGSLGRPRAELATHRRRRAASARGGLKGQYGKSVGWEGALGHSVHVDDLDPEVLGGEVTEGV